MSAGNHSKRLNNKGFTLVEMAIVLVIIGIILGAVIKGQDLIGNARAKQLTTTIKTWSALTYAFVDRMGRLPGDTAKNGIIGDTAAEQTAAASAIGQMSAVGVMTSAPQNPVTVGGDSYWVYMGNTLIGTVYKNVMIVCANAACTQAFSTDQLQIMQAVDTALDGSADAGMGQFRAVTAAVTLTGSGTVNNHVTAVVTAAAAVNQTPAGAATLWTTGTPIAAVWAFDKPY